MNNNNTITDNSTNSSRILTKEKKPELGSVQMDKQLIKKLRILGIKTDRTLYDLVNESAEEFLAKWSATNEN